MFTEYRHFDDEQDCFIAAFDTAGEAMGKRVGKATVGQTAFTGRGY